MQLETLLINQPSYKAPKSCNFLPSQIPSNLFYFSYKYIPEHRVPKYLSFTLFLPSGKKARQNTALRVLNLKYHSMADNEKNSQMIDICHSFQRIWSTNV